MTRLSISLVLLAICCVSFGVISGITVTDWSPSTCPKPCLCGPSLFSESSDRRWRKVINCSSSGLESLPSDLPDSASVLILSLNSIKLLNVTDSMRYLKYLDASDNQILRFQHLQSLKYLRTLVLRNNSLYYLYNNQFSGLSYLRSLDLSFNRIHAIEEHTFVGLSDLQVLHLDSNKLMHLRKEWFYSMPSLRYLHLSRNNIRNIPVSIFEPLSSLSLLNLGYNQLHYIDNGTFIGSSRLETLDISYNELTYVPNLADIHLPSIKSIYLDGNHIYAINPRAFHSLQLLFISINYMPFLTLVEREAFCNLTSLKTLQMHDNNALKYFHPDSFSDVPKLGKLYLHNNALIGLPQEVRSSLPSLRELHFYNNALKCDCNAFWMKEELSLEARNVSFHSVLYDSSVLVCDSPAILAGRLLKSLPEEAIPETCAPTVVAIFNAVYDLSLGEELRMKCFSMGFPTPKIQWHYPKTINADRFEISHGNTLIVRHLRPEDSGVFNCSAENSLGHASVFTNVSVSNKPIRLTVSDVSIDYVTIGWNGSTYRSSISDYQIHYRPSVRGSGGGYRVLHLGGYTKSYTITSLRPNTGYEICIAYLYGTELYYVDCVNVTTTPTTSKRAGITSIDKRIVLGICVFLVLGAAVGCVVTLLKKRRLESIRYRPSRRNDKHSAGSQIPLDPMLEPEEDHAHPRHSIYTSKTALISAQDL